MTTPQKTDVARLAEQGDYIKAKKLCETLCKLVPNDPEAWFLLGSINGALEDFTTAEDCCRRAISLAPQHPMLRYNLGIALLKQQKAVDAITQFEAAIKINPQFTDAFNELGNAQNQTGNPEDAINNYNKAIQQNSSSARYYHNLADTYCKIGKLQNAVDNYQQAIKLQNDFVESFCGLASALIGMFKFDKTIDLLETNIHKLPKTACLYFCLAAAYHEQGETDKARANYYKTLEIDCDHIDAQTGLAAILALQGEYEEAGKRLDYLLEKQPDNSLAIITYITYAYRFGATEKAIELGTILLRNKSLKNVTKSKLYFALADLYEKQGILDKAFDFYRQGNELKGTTFDESNYKKMFSSIINAYSADIFTRFRHKDTELVTPIFIIGMPRSGTSLAEQILASHRDVFGAGELPIINRMIDQLPGMLNALMPYPECLDKLDNDILDQLAAEYLNELRTRSYNKKYVTDKMPLNVIHLGFISLLFPNAKIIHCTRDPRDTCLSCYFNNFSGEHQYAYSLSSLGIFYRMYEKLMNHWSDVIPNPIFELSYEMIVENPEQMIHKLIDFCDLEWDDSCLDFHKTKRTVATASHDQVRQRMYSSSVGRWQSYEKHLDELFVALETAK